MTNPALGTGTASLPHAPDIEKLRQLLALSIQGRGDSGYAWTVAGLAERHVAYYRNAAVLLGLMAEESSEEQGGVTELGRRLAAAPPRSGEEREVFREAVAGAEQLGPFQDYVLGREELTREELDARAERVTGLASSTVRQRTATLRSWRTFLVGGAAPAQLSLLSDALPALPLPPHSRFPTNDGKGQTVQHRLFADLWGAPEALVITGYTSLDYLIPFLGDDRSPGRCRLLLGTEPVLHGDADWAPKARNLDKEIWDYWMDRHISPVRSGRVLEVIEALEAGRIEVRISGNARRRVHAKMVVTAEVATLGSSNFSRSGMQQLLEANARFRKAEERSRYGEASSLAEAIWDSGRNWTEQLIELLRRLLAHTTWQEALGRACHELLDGRWAEHFVRRQGLDGSPLWPSQVQGIAQALWVVEHVGSVLVADATGSGKTRMGAWLLRLLRDNLFTSGRSGSLHLGAVDPVLAAPAVVSRRWEEELARCGINLLPITHGALSHFEKERYGPRRELLAHTQILAVDEGHNFHNQASKRSTALLRSLADHSVAFTATPINRGAADLLPIVDLLGADNLPDETLSLMQRTLWRSRGRWDDLSEQQREQLRAALQKFTVRRTKRQLNALIERDPDAYRNAVGRRCRYPLQRPATYACRGSEADEAAAMRVRELAGRLRGLLNLRSPIELTDSLRQDGWTPEKLVRARLRAAAALARHHVMRSLRSSPAALIEHLHGTEEAQKAYRIEGLDKTASGNVLAELRKSAGRPPRQELEVPEWLWEAAAHEEAVAKEVAIYEEIATLARGLSDRREEEKVRLLVRLARAHPLVLAFDRHPITLALLRGRLKERGLDVLVATGASRSQRQAVEKRFALGAESRQTIALCSDAMSEGLNLQQASAVVLLDMPSTIRQAEQRIGRIDRMDSPHTSIEAHWPEDSEAYALRADERFAARHELVAGLLGSNLELPGEEAEDDAVVKPAELAEKVAQDDAEWTVLQDAFSPVRSLVEGAEALVPDDIYQALTGVKARAQAAVSAVRAQYPWAFLAIEGPRGAPLWVFVDEVNEPVASLEGVVRELRRRLEDQPEDVPLSVRTDEALERLTERVAGFEADLLPPRKRRALKEMYLVLTGYHRETGLAPERRAVIEDLLDLRLRREAGADLRSLADAWLEAIRPYWVEEVQKKRRRRRPLVMSDLRQVLKRQPMSTERLQEVAGRTRRLEPLQERVVAAILGMPEV